MKQFFSNIIKGAEITGFFFRNELKAIIKDPGALLILVFAMIGYPIIYSIAYNKEVVRDLPVAIVDQDNTAASRQLTRMVDATEQLNLLVNVQTMEEAKQLFNQNLVNGILIIPNDFEKNLTSGHVSPISVYADASYFLIYKQTLKGALYASGTLSAGIKIKRLMLKGNRQERANQLREPLKVSTYNLYNPSGGYGSFVMPGMIVIIFQQILMIGIGIVNGTRRERNIFYREVPAQISRLGTFAMIWGKTAAYFVVQMFNAVIALIWIHHWFVFPDKGSLLNIATLFVPFILASIFLALAVSTLFKKREESILFMVFISPIILFLSDISWPAVAIPDVLYKLAHLFPSTAMVPAYLRVRIMGVAIDSVHSELMILLIQTAVYMLFAYFAFRMVLRKKIK